MENYSQPGFKPETMTRLAFHRMLLLYRLGHKGRRNKYEPIDFKGKLTANELLSATVTREVAIHNMT